MSIEHQMPPLRIGGILNAYSQAVILVSYTCFRPRPWNNDISRHVVLMFCIATYPYRSSCHKWRPFKHQTFFSLVRLSICLTCIRTIKTDKFYKLFPLPSHVLQQILQSFALYDNVWSDNASEYTIVAEIKSRPKSVYDKKVKIQRHESFKSFTSGAPHFYRPFEIATPCILCTG